MSPEDRVAAVPTVPMASAASVQLRREPEATDLVRPPARLRDPGAPHLGGVVVWHDFAPKGRDVVLFAREFSRTRPLFWVVDTSLLVYVDGVDSLAYDAPLPVYDRSLIKPA